MSTSAENFEGMYVNISALNDDELAKELAIARGDEAPPESEWWLTLLQQESAKRAYYTAASTFEKASEKAVAALTKAFWPEAKILRVEGDAEGAEFSDRLTAIEVVGEDATSEFTIAEAEKPTDEWDRFYELSREFLDWMIDVDGDWFGEHEIEVA